MKAGQDGTLTKVLKEAGIDHSVGDREEDLDKLDDKKLMERCERICGEIVTEQKTTEHYV